MPQLSKLHHTLRNSDNYQEWHDVALKIDVLTNMNTWKDTNTSSDYPHRLIEDHVTQLRRLLDQKKYPELLQFVQESLYRSVGELGNIKLYHYALSGSKTLISQYLKLIDQSLNTLCDQDIPGISSQEKLDLLIQAEKNFGRPALMLSGGGTFGIYHLGVVSTLIEHNLLPNIISGTSMGSIAAGILASHHDHEIKALMRTPENSNYQPLKKLSIAETLSQKSLLDPDQLYRCIHENIGDITFKEAYERTGREVSITVSPARREQKPRILNYQTAPNVLIAHAAKASCSVPGLFPPCSLKAKSESGDEVPYMESEYWVDGSFATDIPRQRISRLHNANYFIVSQANPHIVPFISHRQQSGTVATIRDIAVTSVYAQGNALLKVARRRLHKQPWRSWLNHASFMLDQDYLGDINIHPKFPPSWYLKVMKNPTSAERDYLLKMGERSTWPKLSMIQDQTRISRTLQACITRLEKSCKLDKPKLTDDQTKTVPSLSNKMNTRLPA